MMETPSSIGIPEDFERNERLNIAQRIGIIGLVTLAALYAQCNKKARGNDIDRRLPVYTDYFETQEDNSFYDEHGKLVFDQNIWWDGENVQAWRLWKKRSTEASYDYQRRRYSSVFMDGERLRRVVSKTKIRSWTQHDPELADRCNLEKEYRRDLLKEPKPEDSGPQPFQGLSPPQP